jgi:predicted transcriptional regulator
MILKEAVEILEAEVVCGEQYLDYEFECAGASDLMSDVLTFGKPGIVLITGLASIQSVCTAEIIEAKAVIYVRGRKPGEEGVELAQKIGLPILSTAFLMYKACGLLYSRGIREIQDF